MATYLLKINGEVVDLAAARLSLEELTFSWKVGGELTFRQAKAHHQADYLEEDDVELAADGVVVFRGRIVERRLRGEPGREFVGYRARGLRDRAGDVAVVDPVTGVPEVTFNVQPPDEDNWQAGRADLTCGEIIKWLIDTFEDELIAAGVLAEGGTHYLGSELDALDVVPPEVVLHEMDVDEAVLTVLRYQADHGCRIDPAQRTFRFLRLSTLTPRTITIDELPEGASDRVLANLLRPTTSHCYTAYEIRGSRELTPAVLSASEGDLEELWDDSLEATWTLARAFAEYEQRDSGTDPEIQGNTLTDSAKNWETDEWVDGFLVERLVGELGQSLICAYRVLSNTATQVVVDGALLEAPSGYTVIYNLYAGVCPYRYVWSRYRIVDPDKRQVVREIPSIFQVASGFFLSHPLVERKLTFNNQEIWVPVSAQIFCDGSGVILTATPLYTVPPGATPLEPGVATGPEDVRLRCAYASGSLVARYPQSGYSGTAYSDRGLERTRVRYLPEFILDNDLEQYRDLAQELLQPLKDINYRGEVPLAGLHWEFADLGRRISVAGRDRQDNPIVTGFEAIAAPLAEVCYDFGRDRTTLMVATNVALALFGAEALEEAGLARLEVLQGRYRQLRSAIQVSIGHPRQNDGGARAGGDRGGEPGTTTTTTEPPTTTTTSEPPTTTTTGEPTTTTGEPTTITSGGTQVQHGCCPEGAPYRWGFVCSGQTDQQGSGCIAAAGWFGDLVWTGTHWVADNQSIGCAISLSCHTEAYDSEGNTYNVWELSLTCAQCYCGWISYEDCPFPEPPDCGLTCTSGTTFVGGGDCHATGPPIDCGDIQIWPK